MLMEIRLLSEDQDEGEDEWGITKDARKEQDERRMHEERGDRPSNGKKKSQPCPESLNTSKHWWVAPWSLLAAGRLSGTGNPPQICEGLLPRAYELSQRALVSARHFRPACGTHSRVARATRGMSLASPWWNAGSGTRAICKSPGKSGTLFVFCLPLSGPGCVACAGVLVSPWICARRAREPVSGQGCDACEVPWICGRRALQSSGLHMRRKGHDGLPQIAVTTMSQSFRHMFHVINSGHDHATNSCHNALDTCHVLTFMFHVHMTRLRPSGETPMRTL
jgi:hypothetical protein